MANKIQIRRGLKSQLPTLSSGEPAYTTDTKELFLGTGSGNINMGGSQWYTGTAMSGTSSASGAYSYSACPQVKIGDIYLNTSYGYIYQCVTAGLGSAAKWTYKGSIRGATGATGAQGSAGVDKQAVYSNTPTVVGTWIDGRDIKRVAWTFTTDEIKTGSILYSVSDIPHCPVPSLASTSIGAVRESYYLARGDNGAEGVTYGSVGALHAGVANIKETLTVYCVVEYITK